MLLGVLRFRDLLSRTIAAFSPAPTQLARMQSVSYGQPCGLRCSQSCFSGSFSFVLCPFTWRRWQPALAVPFFGFVSLILRGYPLAYLGLFCFPARFLNPGRAGPPSPPSSINAGNATGVRGRLDKCLYTSLLPGSVRLTRQFRSDP